MATNAATPATTNQRVKKKRDGTAQPASSKKRRKKLR
ncbi:hypothetical protein BVRB_9g209430 [Beta vulgaris subsp. vulgaris]|nr:hypothetical protein BVRB_9g209430 [Beta vulgaris subsp. vulgaris]